VYYTRNLLYAFQLMHAEPSEIKKRCDVNGSDSPHCRQTRIFQSHSPGGANINSYLIRGFIGPTQVFPSPAQAASRSVLPFLQHSRDQTQMDRHTGWPKKISTICWYALTLSKLTHLHYLVRIRNKL